MKTFTTTAILTLVASIVSTAPAPAPQDYSGFEAQITFQGAAGAQFIESIPANGNQYNIDNVLSISHIVSQGGATCTFYGIDGSRTTVLGAQTIDVGPPQTQIWGSCLAL